MRRYRLHGSPAPAEQYAATDWVVQCDDADRLEALADTKWNAGAWSWWRIVDTTTGDTHAEREY